MKNKSAKFKIVDIILLLVAILPFVLGMIIEITFAPPSDGVSVTGAQIYFTIPLPIQDLPVTEAQVNSLLVMISITALCFYFTHGIRAKVDTKRTLIAEWMVEKLDGLIGENMGVKYFSGFAPFVGAIMALSALSSLSSLVGLFPPTSDINIVAGWAILVFGLITFYKLKAGPVVYMSGFTKPVKLLTPINIISEVATPVSMAFRHYGNVLSGTVISVLLSAAFTGLTGLLLGWLPGFLADIPFLRIGIPAVLSLYFDVFSGCLQAFIFAILTMLYVSDGFPMDEYERRQMRKLEKKLAVQKQKS